LYRVIPPSRSGLNNYIYQVMSGASVQRWFNPYRPPRDAESLAFGLFTAYTLWSGRRLAGGVRRPEYCPPSEAARVARWLDRCRQEGPPAVLDAQAGLAVRVSRAAEAEGIDLSGTFFRVGGEPLTAGKARTITEAGARVACHYAMAEAGRVGSACADPEALDDVHLMVDKIAAIRRAQEAPGRAGAVGALYLTTIDPSTSKLMLNFECGDFAEFTQRRCSCPFGQLGYDTHLTGIGSHEKLTTEGNTFLGSELYALVEEALPNRFGGGPTDYQLVEEEVGGLPTLSVVVAPGVGEVDAEEVLSVVYAFLRERPQNRLMADFWAQGESLRVVRREPHLTAAAKILPLHVGAGS
jgi:hypothetical protein